MTERTPLPHPEQQPDSFEPETISRALRTRPEAIADVYGDGLRWRIGEDEQTTLDVFPDTDIGRVSLPDAQLLFRAPASSIEDGQVVFASHRERSSMRVTLRPDSSVTIMVSP